jgi:hypothetical protein
MKYLSCAIILCLGTGLFAWWSLHDAPALIDQAEAEKAVPISESEHAPAEGYEVPVAEIPPPSTRFKFLTDPSIRWQVRANHLRELDANTLSQADVDTLYELLDHRPLPEHAEDWWTVVNEIMEQMRIQAIGRERYAKALLAIIRDSSAPEVARDYSIQHLMQWIAPQGENLGLSHEEDPALIREAVTATITAIMDPELAQTYIPGTALNMLVDASSGVIEPQIIDEAIARLEPWLRGVIPGRISVDPINRYDAIGAAGSLGLREHYPMIRGFAFDEEVDPEVRLLSIASLAIYDDESDLEPMRQIARSNSPLSYPAKRALEKMTNDQSNPFASP